MSVFNFSNHQIGNRNDLQSSGNSLLRIRSTEDENIKIELLKYLEKGDLNGILKLFEEGLEIANIKGLNDFTSIHYAVQFGHAHLLANLIRLGVPIEARTTMGETALHLAAYSGRLLIAEQLIDKGADINALNKDNETPLFYAVRKSMPAVVRFLIQHGADVNIVDSYGDKAYDIALDSRTRECFSTKLIVSNSNYSSSNSTDTSNDNNFPEVKHGMPSNFPYETLIKVFLYLEAKDVCRAACVSGKWHRACETPEIWSTLGIRRWEKALQSSLGFDPSPAAVFRPSKKKVVGKTISK